MMIVELQFRGDTNHRWPFLAPVMIPPKGRKYLIQAHGQPPLQRFVANTLLYNCLLSELHLACRLPKISLPFRGERNALGRLTTVQISECYLQKLEGELAD